MAKKFQTCGVEVDSNGTRCARPEGHAGLHCKEFLGEDPPAGPETCGHPPDIVLCEDCFDRRLTEVHLVGIRVGLEEAAAFVLQLAGENFKSWNEDAHGLRQLANSLKTKAQEADAKAREYSLKEKE